MPRACVNGGDWCACWEHKQQKSHFDLALVAQPQAECFLGKCKFVSVPDGLEDSASNPISLGDLKSPGFSRLRNGSQSISMVLADNDGHSGRS